MSFFQDRSKLFTDEKLTNRLGLAVSFDVDNIAFGNLPGSKSVAYALRCGEVMRAARFMDFEFHVGWSREIMTAQAFDALVQALTVAYRTGFHLFVTAMLVQQFHNVVVVLQCRHVQGRLVVFVPGIDSGPVGQKQFCQIPVTLSRRHV